MKINIFGNPPSHDMFVISTGKQVFPEIPYCNYGCIVSLYVICFHLDIEDASTNLGMVLES